MKLPLAPGNKKTWIVDIEVFQNFFYAAFYNGDEWREYFHKDLAQLAEDLKSKDLVLVGYNNHDYDDIMLKLICVKPDITTTELYHASKDIIFNKDEGVRQRIFELQYADNPWAYSIDVFQLLNKKGSLKEWACRIGSSVVAETPVDFDLPLPDDQIENVVKYCKNDVQVTKELFIKNFDKVLLRKALANTYSLSPRVYVKSEQGVAEHTFLTLHKGRTGETTTYLRQAAKENPDNLRTEWALTDIVSKKVQYATEPFQTWFTQLIVGRAFADEKESWHLDTTALDKKNTVTLADTLFSIGVGGIHSVDAPDTFVCDDDYAIVDLDVASYYPSLIIEEGLYPKHLGPAFCDDMRSLRDRRLKAKRAGDKRTADALKIVINATFGKLNDKYSPLRSVPDAMRVTINGQLYILMLVEALHAINCAIISANTDGVTVKIKRDNFAELEQVKTWWQSHTKMELEQIEYSAIYRRDINNYMAMTIDGKIKYKGAISQDGGKGDGKIVKLAAEEYILNGIPPSITIENCKNPLDFMYYLRSKNGGELYFDKDKIGKSIRWYAAKDGQVIKRLNPATVKRAANWALIPNGHKAKLALDTVGWTIDTMTDIDLTHYETEAWKLIDSMSAPQKEES